MAIKKSNQTKKTLILMLIIMMVLMMTTNIMAQIPISDAAKQQGYHTILYTNTIRAMHEGVTQVSFASNISLNNNTHLILNNGGQIRRGNTVIVDSNNNWTGNTISVAKGGTGLTGCSNGQVLKWSGGAWICGTDETGGTGGSSTWYLSVVGRAGTQAISSGDTVVFQAGSGVTITRNDATVIISATGSGGPAMPTCSVQGHVLKWSVGDNGWYCAEDLTSGLFQNVAITGLGEINRIPYFTASREISGSNLRWDSSNNRLGIGGTPSATLHVYGNTRIDGSLTMTSGNAISVTSGNFIIQLAQAQAGGSGES